MTTCDLKMVFGSLLKVADHRAMVTTNPWWSLGVSATSLQPTGPVGCREVLCSLLSVGECRTMVFSGLLKVFVLFSSHRPLIVANQLPTAPNTTKLCFLSAISQRSVGDRSVTCRRSVSDHFQRSGDLLRLVANLVSPQYK